jgi:hypothetical protein
VTERYEPPQHRICALCRHLQSIESGREFPGIVDSEYMVFRCAVFGWTTREDYLMDSEPARSFAKQEPFDCERWEPWAVKVESSE